MPKPPLFEEESILEREIIRTMREGLHRWRPDLDYPESASDMQACVRALLVMFSVERRPMPVDLGVPCGVCLGTGYWSKLVKGVVHRTACTECDHGRDTQMVGQ